MFPRGEDITLREGRHVRCHLAGDEHAETAIYLCHGLGGRAEQWRSLWPGLVASGARLIAWDMPGHGHSPSPRAAVRYAGTEMAADFIALIERYGARRNFVVAHSYGAKLTLFVLQSLHETGREGVIERVALLGAPHPGISPASHLLRFPAWVLALMRGKLERAFRAAAWDASADIALVDYEERCARRNSLAVFKAVALQAPVLDPATLPQLDLPVLVLCGDADHVTPIEASRANANALPNAELRVLERCGHQIMLERPAETLAALETFFGAARA